MRQPVLDVLLESLGSIQRLRGKTIVVEYGGDTMVFADLQAPFINDLVLLSSVGLRLVLVHGGNQEINSWLPRHGVADSLTMEVVETALIGKVNKPLVSLINSSGATAIGLCGKDAGLLTASPSHSYVGEVSRVNPSTLHPILASGHIPVIASVAADIFGQTYIINTDTAAGEIAAALRAERLILLTETAGIWEDPDDPDMVVKEINVDDVRKMLEDGRIDGEMKHKVNCCLRSLAQGVQTASLIDSRFPHTLLFEIITNIGGTRITA